MRYNKIKYVVEKPVQSLFISTVIVVRCMCFV